MTSKYWGEGWAAVGGPHLGREGLVAFGTLLYTRGVRGGQDLPLGRIPGGFPILKCCRGGPSTPKAPSAPREFELGGTGSVPVLLPPEGTDGLWLPQSSRHRGAPRRATRAMHPWLRDTAPGACPGSLEPPSTPSLHQTLLSCSFLRWYLRAEPWWCWASFLWSSYRILSPSSLHP